MTRTQRHPALILAAAAALAVQLPAFGQVGGRGVVTSGQSAGAVGHSSMAIAAAPAASHAAVLVYRQQLEGCHVALPISYVEPPVRTAKASAAGIFDVPEPAGVGNDDWSYVLRHGDEFPVD